MPVKNDLLSVMRRNVAELDPLRPGLRDPRYNAFSHSLSWGFVKLGNTIRATGFSGQFLTQYEVHPRNPGDVQFVP